MPQFVIERTVPGVGGSSPEDLQGIAMTSAGALAEMSADIQWLHSYVTDDKIYCVYHAADADLVREHARRGGFPADAVSAVRGVIDPSTAADGPLVRAGRR